MAIPLIGRGSSPTAMLHPRDKRLAQRVVDKDPEAFEDFFTSYFPRVYRFCAARMRNTPGEADVEDIVQEVIVKALRSLDQYRGEASLFTWLCQIGRREMSDWHRRQGGRATLARGIDDDPALRAALESVDLEPPGDLERRFALARLVQLAMDRLPNDYAVALEQKYVDGRTVDEIARRLGRTRIATQSLLARARAAFARCYGDLERELGANQ